MKTCSFCGNTISDTSKFCPKCGAKITAGVDQKQKMKTAKKTESKGDQAVGIDDLTAATLKSLLCVHCQSPLQPTNEDWKKGYTTCAVCGEQTELPGHRKTDVDYDSSKQLKGHLALANRAWSAKNYTEALEYYTKVLEYAPENIVAIYRKGICSFQVNCSVSEFQVNIADASCLLNNQLSRLRDISEEHKSEEDRKSEEDYKEIAELMGKEIYSFLNSLAVSANFPDYPRRNDLVLLDKMECEREINFWLIVARVYYISSEYVLNLGYKEKILDDGVSFIDKILNSEVSYQESGYNRRGKPTVKNIPCKISDDNLSSLFDMYDKMTKMDDELSASNYVEGKNKSIEKIDDGPNVDTSIIVNGKPKSYKGNEPYIFISYAHKNDEKVLDIIKHLQNQGYRVFYDEGIETGSAWNAYIGKHIEGCSCFCAMFSDDYWASEICKNELSVAVRDCKKPSFGIYLQETQMPVELKIIYGLKQDLFYYEFKDQEEFLEKLYSTELIEECLGKPLEP